MNSLHKVKAGEILELLQESKQGMFGFMSSFWRAAMVCLYFLVTGSWFELLQVIRAVPPSLRGFQPFLWIIQQAQNEHVECKHDLLLGELS